MQTNGPTKILHVVSVSFSLSYFVGKQFQYFMRKDPVRSFYVACSPSEDLMKLSRDLSFTPVPLNISRTISPIADLGSILKLIKFIHQNNITMVVGHTPKGGMIAMIAAYFAGISKRTYFRHGIMYETSTGLKRVLLKCVERITGLFATQVVCVSREIKAISESENLSSARKNILLGKGTCNGIDCMDKYNPEKKSLLANELKNQLALDADSFVLGYVGRLVKDKGINELVDAWQIIAPKYPKAKLLLVGPFEYRDKVNDATRDIIISSPSIIYTGFVEDASVYYLLMDAFILPSYREGFPTVVLEASSMEVPVLTTRATGCVESIIENETGVFFGINKLEIAAAIDLFINNPDRIRQMGINGRNFVKSDFEQTKIWDIIESKILNA